MLGFLFLKYVTKLKGIAQFDSKSPNTKKLQRNGYADTQRARYILRLTKEHSNTDVKKLFQRRYNVSASA